MKLLARLGLAFLLILSLSAFDISDLWSNKKTPLPVLTPVKPEIKISALWTNHAVGDNGKGFLRFQPVIAGDNLYVSDHKGHVAAININRGETKWQKNVGVPLVAGPAVGDGKVFVAATMSKVLALDAHHGQILWQASVPNELTTKPAFGDGTVIAKNINGALYALKSKNGKLQWKYAEGAPRLLLQGSSAPVIFQGVVLGSFADGKIAIIHLKNGKLIWQSTVVEPNGITELGRMVDIDAAPVVDGGAAYIASYQGNISAIDLHSAKLLWFHKLSSYAGAGVSSSTVFVSDTDGTVWAFNRSNGQVVWKQTVLKRRQLTRPAVVGDYVVVADTKGLVHWLDSKDGHFVARQTLSKKGFVAAPLVDGDTVYLQDRNGRVIAETLQS